MPVTSKGHEILENMQKTYGPEKGERVFYASKNAGKISGVDEGPSDPPAGPRVTEPAPGTVKSDLQHVAAQAPHTEGMSNFYAEQIAAQDDQAMKITPGPPFETQTQAQSGTYPGRDAEASRPGGVPKETPTSPSSLPETISVGQTVNAAMSRWNSGRG